MRRTLPPFTCENEKDVRSGLSFTGPKACHLIRHSSFSPPSNQNLNAKGVPKEWGVMVGQGLQLRAEDGRTALQIIISSNTDLFSRYLSVDYNCVLIKWIPSELGERVTRGEWVISYDPLCPRLSRRKQRTMMSFEASRNYVTLNPPDPY
jgi:hypothetical protein